jgi:hypothetical protein
MREMIAFIIALTPLAWPLIWERCIEKTPAWGGDFSREQVAIQTIVAVLICAPLAIAFTR